MRNDEASYLSDALSDMITPGKGLSLGQKAHLMRVAAFDPIRSIVKNMTGMAGYGVRQLYYRKYLRRMGEGCIIDPYVFIEPPDRVSIGSFVMIDAFSRLEGGKGIRIGNRCHITSGCVLNGGGGIWIGDNVAIASGSKIYSATDSWGDGKRMTAMAPRAERAVVEGTIRIHDDAFIGLNSIVLPGVTIGEGAVVGAGSVVTKDIPPWKFVVGSPARVIQDRPPIRLE